MKLKEAILSNPELPVIITFTNDEEGEHERCYEDPDAIIGEVFRNEEYMLDKPKYYEQVLLKFEQNKVAHFTEKLAFCS